MSRETTSGGRCRRRARGMAKGHFSLEGRSRSPIAPGPRTATPGRLGPRTAPLARARSTWTVTARGASPASGRAVPLCARAASRPIAGVVSTRQRHARRRPTRARPTALRGGARSATGAQRRRAPASRDRHRRLGYSPQRRRRRHASTVVRGRVVGARHVIPIVRGPANARVGARGRLKTDAFVSLRRPNRLRRPHARRGPTARARPARRAGARPGNARARAARDRPGSRGGTRRARGRTSSHSARASSRDERRFSRAARRSARSSLSGGGADARSTGFGASRPRGPPSEFGASGDDFGSDASRRTRTRRARRVGAAEGAEGAGTRGAAAPSGRVGGVVPHGIRTGIWGFGCFQGKRRGLCEANGSRAALAPDGARGLPAPPAARAARGRQESCDFPRGADGAVRARPLFAGTAAPSASGYGRVSASPPHASGYGNTRTGSARSRRRTGSPFRIIRATLDAVAPFEDDEGSKP